MFLVVCWNVYIFPFLFLFYVLSFYVKQKIQNMGKDENDYFYHANFMISLPIIDIINTNIISIYLLFVLLHLIK